MHVSDISVFKALSGCFYVLIFAVFALNYGKVSYIISLSIVVDKPADSVCLLLADVNACMNDSYLFRLDTSMESFIHIDITLLIIISYK